MSLSAYDNAIVEKLKKVFPNVVLSHEERWSTNATDKDGELALPMIVVWRMSNALAFEGAYSTDSIVFGGWRERDNGDLIKEHALPVNIVYQLDIVSDRRKEVDDIFRELAMLLYEEPTLSVKFNDGSEEPFIRDFTIHIQDNSTMTEYGSMDDRGKLYREIINIEIPNARLLFIEGASRVNVIPIRMVAVQNKDSFEQEIEEF